MEDKIKNIMSAVFNVEIEKIDDSISPDTLDEWDSLKHMNLIIALEEEFNVEFSEEEIIEMISYSLIKSTLENKLASN